MDDVGGTLEQLWLNYNHIDRLDNLGNLTKLHTLFIANNKIKNWDELNKIVANPALTIIMFVGNPFYGERSR